MSKKTNPPAKEGPRPPSRGQSPVFPFFAQAREPGRVFSPAQADECPDFFSSSHKGIVLSTESLMAGLLLMGALMLAFGPLSPTPEAASEASPVLRHAAMDTLELGAKSGAWLEPLGAGASDDKIRRLADGLPPALCMQIEIYQSGRQPSDLAYAYVRASCGRGTDVPEADAWRAIVNRSGPSSQSYYWVRARAWPRSGG